LAEAERPDMRRRVRQALRHRRHLPHALRWTMAAAGVALAAWGGWVAFCFVLGQGGAALRLAGLTVAVGREPAMLSAYTGEPPIPVWVVLGLAPLQDIATVLVSLSLLAWALRHLRWIRLVERAISGLEAQAMEKRHWVRRWGLWGVVGFYFLPGFGSGALAACALGLLAGLPLRNLALGLASGGAVVSLFWAVALYFASFLLPSGSWSKWLPVLFLGIIVAAAGWNAWKRRGQPARFYLDWHVRPSDDDRARLEEAGIQPEVDAVVVRVDRLSKATGIDRRDRPRLRATAELMLVPGLPAAAAKALASLGVHGIDDLAALETDVVRDVLRHDGVDGHADVERWHKASQAMRRRHDR
jgi:uncharacterized membrane protein/predicted flap endonuclease-1-like 5' DNA nuclease